MDLYWLTDEDNGFDGAPLPAVEEENPETVWSALMESDWYGG